MVNSNGNGNGSNSKYQHNQNYYYNYYNNSPSFNGNYVDDENHKDTIIYSREGEGEEEGEEGCVGYYIEHKVSKFDTLPGVAIMYGVEVGDIKKKNGLVTDLQMFGLNSLQIPLPGRHPPSPSFSYAANPPNPNPNPNATTTNATNTRHRCSEQTTPHHRLHLDFLLDSSFQSFKLASSHMKVSTAMSSLRGYYGLNNMPRDPKTTSQGFEIPFYSQAHSSSREEDVVQYTTPSSPASNPPQTHHRKSTSLANAIILHEINNDGFPGSLMPKSGEIDSERSNEKLVRRRQKSVADFTSHTKLLMREENNASAYSAVKGKVLAQSSHASNHNTSLFVDAELGGSTSVPINLQDSSTADRFSAVSKSSSTSSLQEQDASSSLIWQTPKWNLKPDLQAFTAAAIAKPIFDGLPKPVAGRRNKAALD